MYAHDGEEAETWFWSGFGMVAVDAMRSLEPVGGGEEAGGRIQIREAGPDDLDVLLPLGHALQRYLAAAPTFLALLKPETREGEAAWLGGRDHALWLAFDGDKAVGYMRNEPSYDDAAYVITDPKTLSITGAYLLEPYRRSGVAARLLGRIVDWGRRHGYERCAVDFEAANLEGAASGRGTSSPSATPSSATLTSGWPGRTGAVWASRVVAAGRSGYSISTVAP